MAAIHGKDVFVRMPTSGGKSLCVFLTPLAVSDTAMGIVISPLNGLMDQQVYSSQHIAMVCKYILHCGSRAGWSTA